MIAKQFVKPSEPSQMFEADGRPWFEVNADEMYPAMIEYILDLVAHPEKRSNTESERHYLNLASKVPHVAWANALAAEDPTELTPEDLHDRAVALEIARKFFTAKLREEIGEMMGLRIAGSEKWKLHVQVQV
jgi:hypothetical protein